jgi:hypothetical protein
MVPLYSLLTTCIAMTGGYRRFIGGRHMQGVFQAEWEASNLWSRNKPAKLPKLAPASQPTVLDMFDQVKMVL